MARIKRRGRIYRRDRVYGWVGALFLRAALWAVWKSLRLEIVTGAEHLERLAAGGDPAILTFWHDGALYQGLLVRRLLLRRGARITVLTSLSPAGQMTTYLARMWGCRVVRGSATRGGTAGLREVHRSLTRDRHSPLVAPDGPRGPRHRAKSGVIVLAQMSGAPVLPRAVAAAPSWRLGTWDRALVPVPFSRVRVAVGDPVRVPRDLEPEGLEERVRAIEETLERLGRRAESGLLG